jgi:peptide/nickel transport system permease protein
MSAIEHIVGQDPGDARLPPAPAARARSRSAAGQAAGATRFVGTRVATIVVASFLIFMAISAAPGNPVDVLLGANATPAQRAAARHELGLDKPVLERYGNWLAGAVHGDFGESVVYKRSIGPLISARIETTLLLVAYAAVLILGLGLGLGIVGGAFRRAGPAVAALSGFLMGVPIFVAAQVLVAVAALRWGLFPAQGAGSGLGDRLYHLTLPAVALALSFSAWVTQVTMATVREERAREHVITARGRGVAPVTVFRRHVLRNAAIPMVTVSGLTVAGLVAGAVVAEQAFNLAGIGSLLVASVSAKDYNVVVAVSVILVAVFVVVTSVIDILQRRLDPRLRTQAR